MDTIDLLERALRAVEGLGYRIRQDWLEGQGGGCEIKGQKWLFLDLASAPAEQLHLVAEVLSREVAHRRLELEPQLRRFIDGRRAA
jgi:hypothetical protein